MRKTFIISFFLLFNVISYAQFRISDESSIPQAKVVQVDNYDFGTLLFLEYTAPSDSSFFNGGQWINFDDKTYLSVPGSNKKFKMLSTVNMPINSEAEQKKMLFDFPGQKHHFILEFEKLPEGVNTFDLIQNSDNPLAFNINNIVINRSDSVSYINIDDFVEDYPLKEYGSYFVKGTEVFYVKYNDIIIKAIPSYVDIYGKYFSINFTIQNYQDRSILFNPENITAEGYKHPQVKSKKSKKREYIDDSIYYEEPIHKNNGHFNPNYDDSKDYDFSISIPINVELLSYDEYDHIVHKKQQWNAFWKEFGETLSAVNAGFSSSSTSFYGDSNTTTNAYAYGNVGNIDGFVRARGSSYTTVFGQSYTTSYNGLAAYVASQQAASNIAEMNNFHRKIRSQIGEGYAKKHTIPSETEYSGFFNIKYVRSLHNLHVNFSIDGENFTFYF